MPHYEYFCCDHDSNELLLDDVFKIEEINDVLPSALLDHLSIEVNEIPKLNPDYTLPELEGKYTNWKGDYYSLYNNESKEIVSEVYKSDISNFNYKFGK